MFKNNSLIENVMLGIRFIFIITLIIVSLLSVLIFYEYCLTLLETR
jgi:hypothetical protein